MADTGARGVTQWAFVGATVALALAAALAATPRFAIAETPRARVLWVRADHAYVALPEGEHAEEGDSVRFEDRGKPVAVGRVSMIVNDEMGVVSLTSGTLERAKKLDRVRVFVTKPPVTRRATLRIALPSGDNLLFRCGGVTPQLPATAPSYRSERIDGHLTRLTRDSTPTDGLWPDTLLAYFFYDPLDAEIALERGDVDIAVFWPGDLSRRVREDARWHGFPMGSRRRGVLALVGAECVANAGLDSVAAVAFNDALFRGDLGLRNQTRPTECRPGGVSWRIDVDESLPGREAIRSRIPYRSMAYSVPIPKSAARLLLVDAPSDTTASSTFQPIFNVRCPVVCATSLRPLVNAIGADTFADMSQCVSATEESKR